MDATTEERLASLEAMQGRIEKRPYFLKGGPRRPAGYKCPDGWHVGPCAGCKEPMEINTNIDAAERAIVHRPYLNRDEGQWYVETYVGMLCACDGTMALESGCYNRQYEFEAEYEGTHQIEEDPELRARYLVHNRNKAIDDPHRRETPYSSKQEKDKYEASSERM
jgi:hypothetical protein